MIDRLLLGLDQNIVFLVIFILFIIMIFAFIKKAMKAVIILFVLLLVTFGLIPAANRLQDEYNMKLDGHNVTFTVNGHDVTFDMREIERVETERVSENEISVTLYPEDSDEFTLIVPEEVSGIIEKTISKFKK